MTSTSADRHPDSGDARTAYRITEAEKGHVRGWAYVAMRGKRPFQKEWQVQPAPDLGMVRSMAAAGNVGVRTGAISGIVVIDDDTPDGSGVASLALPKTPTSITGRGGRHHYFRAPFGISIPNSTSRLAPGVDVKGERGVIVGVGSVHPDTGRTYDWAEGLSPDQVPLAELPAQIISSLVRKKREAIAPGSPEHDLLREYAGAILQRQVADLARVAEGKRNDALNRAGFVLGKYIGSGLLDRYQVEEALHAAALAAGLEDREIVATMRSGVDSGMLDPHDLRSLLKKARRAAEDAGSIALLSDEKKRPIIIIEGGKLPEIVDAAEQALLHDGGMQLYQRENLLVRMTRASSVQLDDGIRRPKGALLLTMIEPAYLVERFTRAACFQKFDARMGDFKIVDCTERIAATYLARKGFWRVPILRAVVEAPTLRPDGSILQTPGYDEITGLFFDSGGIEFEPVPENPTIDDALSALALLHEVISKFPFVEMCDRSVALAAMITGVIRRSIRTAPLFAFRAPKMASGKSLLADVVAMLATGRPSPVMPQGKDEDEDRKRLLALLIEGEPVNCIDNIERPFASSALCSILTQVSWKDRLLGKTLTVTAPTCATWLATGNNLVISGDLTTRSLICDLDPKVERPEERKFDVNLYEYIPEQRVRLVPAALTMLRAYHLAGRPNQGLSVFGRFEGWSDWIRSTLVWCGEADPCETRRRIEYVDPVRRQIQNVLQSWVVVVGEAGVTAAEVISKINLSLPEARALKEALEDAVLGGNGELNAIKVGNWLAKIERRLEGGLKVERAGERQGTLLWKVSRA